MARILIIEDDDQFRAMLRETLERAGYEIVEAPNGKEGIKIYREEPADLIITDMLMPVMPGSRVISELRDDFPNVKIIAISGGGNIYESDSYLSFAKELGAQRIFEKPLQRKKLLKAVKEILD